MRLSQYLITTSKEAPREAECISHKLMLRAGLIMKFAAGIYSYLPLGYRVLAKITSIIEEEMNQIGAHQLLLSFVQPADIWKKSGRWESYGEELVRFKDRKGMDFALGPTHEEMITELAKYQINSYKRLPLIVYQVQTKFRDEPRPRAGVIRTREFLMKDAYSFCQSEKELETIYEKMKQAYERIFSRCLLNYKLVEADTGPIGGKRSDEFIALAPLGEDKILECEKCGYTAKLEKAAYVPEEKNQAELQAIEEVSTPGIQSVKQLTQFLGCKEKNVLKTIFYQTEEGLVVALIRGDHEVNEQKLASLLKVEELKLASDDLVKRDVGVELGFAGPVGLDKYKLVVDNTVIKGINFIAGANRKNTHLLNVNASRDFKPTIIGDIGFPISGDRCSLCRGKIRIKRGIEIGHLFWLGEKYSRSLKATFLDKTGKEKYFIMGCYGIGVSRLLAAIIEQNHDEEGIIWPKEIAPFQAVVIATSPQVFKVAEEIYLHLRDGGLDILWDDRELNAGVKFNDADLIGIPFKIIVGNAFLKENKIEIKTRRQGKAEKVKKDAIFQKMKELVENAK